MDGKEKGRTYFMKKIVSTEKAPKNITVLFHLLTISSKKMI
jgi:hypothetical protein